MEKNSKIFLTGYTGLVGLAILRKFKVEGFTNVIVRTSKELDLRIQVDVETFF